MKRLLLILMALSIGLSAKAAYEYDATINGKVTVTDQSYKSGTNMVYQYQLEYAQVGTNSAGSTFNSNAVLIIYPDGPSIAGTFTLADGSVDPDSYVKYGSAYRYVVDYTGKPTTITITDNGNDTYTMSGAFRTKNGSNYYYYYYDASDSKNTFEYIPPKPYDDEPEAGSFTFNASGAAVIISDYVSSEGLITVDVNDKNYNFVELAIVADKFELPAGTYSVSDSGANGTIVKASGAKGGYYPEGSYMNYSYDNYYVTGGSVEVSYSQDKSTITISGTVTSAHGSTIAISATADNPFKPYEPETYALTVSEIVATVHPKDTYENAYVSLAVTARNGEAECNGNIRVNSGVLEGTYNYENFHSSMTYFGKDASGWYNNLIYGQDKENAMTIEKTGNPNEYKLNSRISCGSEKDYVIYTIKDAIFTWVAPTPWDAEPDETSTIDAEYACEAEVTRDGKTGTTAIFVENSSLSPLTLVFTGTGDLMPCRYIVSDTKAAGTIVASEGRQGTGWDAAETGTWYGEGIGLYDYNPYYITGGYIDVNYIGNNVEFVGQLISKKGSTINVHAVCPNTVCEHPLPTNMMSGSLLGTSAQYMFAYDVTTTADLKLRLDATLSTSAPVDGLKVSVKVKDNEVDMSYDSQTGRCTAPGIYDIEKDEELEITVIFKYSAGSTTSKTIKYTVE